VLLQFVRVIINVKIPCYRFSHSLCVLVVAPLLAAVNVVPAAVGPDDGKESEPRSTPRSGEEMSEAEGADTPTVTPNVRRERSPLRV
jgi:hypothetical protein